MLERVWVSRTRNARSIIRWIESGGKMQLLSGTVAVSTGKWVSRRNSVCRNLLLRLPKKSRLRYPMAEIVRKVRPVCLRTHRSAILSFLSLSLFIHQYTPMYLYIYVFWFPCVCTWALLVPYKHSLSEVTLV